MTQISSEIDSKMSIKIVLISIFLVFINFIKEGNKNNKCLFFPFKHVSDNFYLNYYSCDKFEFVFYSN